MNINKESLEPLTKDLRKEEPRDASEKLAGYEMGARCLDKCRATLLGRQGDFMYGCPMDRQFLSKAGLDANDFKEFVAGGGADEEVAKWIEEHAQTAR